jgi:hypothetical protein
VELFEAIRREYQFVNCRTQRLLPFAIWSVFRRQSSLTRRAQGFSKSQVFGSAVMDKFEASLMRQRKASHRGTI